MVAELEDLGTIEDDEKPLPGINAPSVPPPAT